MAGKGRRSCLIVALMGVGLGLGVWTGPARAVEMALQPPPGSPEWLKRQNELAIRAARQAYWPEAVYRWAKILRFRPDWAAIWNNLAVAMEAMGQWDKALAYYRKALELEPDNTAYRANYIRFREIQQKYRKSPPPGSSDAQERAGGTKGWRDRVQTP
jgi:tetratricopeptide (TPR) repeat protein